MALYHVTYYYLATGMEGHAQREDFGVVEADSPEAAVTKVIDGYFFMMEQSTKDFVRGCLSARPMRK